MSATQRAAALSGTPVAARLQLGARLAPLPAGTSSVDTLQAFVELAPASVDYLERLAEAAITLATRALGEANARVAALASPRTPPAAVAEAPPTFDNPFVPYFREFKGQFVLGGVAIGVGLVGLAATEAEPLLGWLMTIGGGVVGIFVLWTLLSESVPAYIRGLYQQWRLENAYDQLTALRDQARAEYERTERQRRSDQAAAEAEQDRVVAAIAPLEKFARSSRAIADSLADSELFAEVNLILGRRGAEPP